MGVLYEHWRLDKNECFYIGKAQGKNPYARAYDLSPRNKYHKHIVNILRPLGLVEVRTSEFPNITKPELNNLETLAIAHHKMYLGRRLTNIAKGGDGGDTVSNLNTCDYELFCKLVKNGHANRSKENKKEATRKRFDTLRSRSEGERQESSRRLSIAIKKGYSSLTEEKIKASSKIRSLAAKDAHARKTPEEKKAHGEAISRGRAVKKADPDYVRPLSLGRILHSWWLSNIKNQHYWGC